jgi:hypothetical protein
MSENQPPKIPTDNSSGNYMLDQPTPDLALPMMKSIAPASIKVFGILHLILAGYGILMSIFSLGGLLFQKKIMEISTSMTGDSSLAAQEAQIKFQQETAIVNYTQLIFTFILAMVLIYAAINLLKNKDRGRKQTNLYAWMAIGSKIILIFLSLTIVVPATKRMMYSSIVDIGGSSTMTSSLDSMVTFGAGFGVIMVYLLGLIYPVLCLVLLNKTRVKEYLFKK